MTVMSATPAFVANSSLDQPFAAMSSAINCALNRTGRAMLDSICIQTIDPAGFHCQQQKATRHNRSQGGAIASSGAVPPRPKFHKELGRFFAELREAKGWTQRQAGDIASRKKLKGVTRQVILRLEAGRTKNAEPEVLRGLADLYGMTYEALAATYLSRRYGLRFDREENDRDQEPDAIDLLRHSAAVQHAPPGTSTTGEGGLVADAEEDDETLPRTRVEPADIPIFIRSIRGLLTRIEEAVAGGQDADSSGHQATGTEGVRGARGRSARRSSKRGRS